MNDRKRFQNIFFHFVFLDYGTYFSVGASKKSTSLSSDSLASKSLSATGNASESLSIGNNLQSHVDGGRISSAYHSL